MLVVSATSLSRSRFRSRRTAVSRDYGKDLRDGLYKDEGMPDLDKDETVTAEKDAVFETHLHVCNSVTISSAGR
ncbi:hypothetical protein ACROYT_G027959 [Oculina patagonica]